MGNPNNLSIEEKEEFGRVAYEAANPESGELFQTMPPSVRDRWVKAAMAVLVRNYYPWG